MSEKNTSEAKHKNAGKVFSDEHKARISAAKKGKKQSAEHVQKRVLALNKYFENKRKKQDGNNSQQT